MRFNASTRPAEFCACGASIDAQCNVCASGICSECDVVAMMRNAPEGALPTLGFGYVGDGYDRQIVVGRRLRHKTYFGSRLPLAKLLAVVAEAQGRSIHHVCLECLGHAVPEAADWIASGEVCQVPECVSTATRTCRRCGTAGCHAHLLSRADWSRVEIALEHGPMHPSLPPQRVTVPAPADLCGLCRRETELALSNVCSQLYPSLHVRDQYFSVPVRHRGSERRYRQECAKSLAIAEAYVAEWGGWWSELAATPPPERADAFAEGRCYFTVDKGYVLFPDTMPVGEIRGVCAWAIQDVRESVRPTACGSSVA